MHKRFEAEIIGIIAVLYGFYVFPNVSLARKLSSKSSRKQNGNEELM